MFSAMDSVIILVVIVSADAEAHILAQNTANNHLDAAGNERQAHPQERQGEANQEGVKSVRIRKNAESLQQREPPSSGKRQAEEKQKQSKSEHADAGPARDLRLVFTSAFFHNGQCSSSFKIIADGRKTRP
jgi:hypothetical protein